MMCTFVATTDCVNEEISNFTKNVTPNFNLHFHTVTKTDFHLSSVQRRNEIHHRARELPS